MLVPLAFGSSVRACRSLLPNPAPAAGLFRTLLPPGPAWSRPVPAGGKFWELPPRATPMPVDVGAGSSSVQPRDSRCLDIVHLTAELAPIAKVSAHSLVCFACCSSSLPAAGAGPVPACPKPHPAHVCRWAAWAMWCTGWRARAWRAGTT